MRRSALLSIVLILIGNSVRADDDGIALSVLGSGSALSFEWVGGRPNYQFLRGSSAASLTDVENLRAVTAAQEYAEEPLRPASGAALYYLVRETPLQAGSLPLTWIDGSNCAEPQIQVHAYNVDSYILRQSLCTNFEAPFIYLLFGEDKVLMQDTGAGGIQLDDTVYAIIDQWLFDHGKSSIQLIVSHSHGHGDHVAGDALFQGQPNTTVVGTSAAAVAAFFGIANWPTQAVEYDLGGGRIVDVVPIPGHQTAHIALYDRQTGLLFTGDTLYAGRCYISAFSAYRASIQRLVDFVAGKPVVWVLGTHVEMTDTPFVDFPFGATVHPNEHELELRREHLLELLAGVDGMAGAPHIEAHADFIIYPF